MNQEKLYWFSTPERIKRAKEWLNIIESANSLGIVPNKLLIYKLRTTLDEYKTPLKSISTMKSDWQISAMVLNFIKILQQGNIHFKYDEINVSRDSVYVNQLLEMNMTVEKIVSKLDCVDRDYLVLKKYLQDSLTTNDTFKLKTVIVAMNYRRYLTINHQSEYILINIPETEADYFSNDALKIHMRVVVGKKSTPTPVFASYITSIVTFPNWNVPHSIAVNEILPKVKRHSNYLEQHNLDVVDKQGVSIEDADLNWKEYNSKNFPYFFRQSTGAGNALGVLKFNLRNPFSIFLHATSWQGVFEKDYRFRSHGCIRLEKPFELAKNILRGKIDMEELRQGKINTKPQKLEPPQKIPVFIIYMPLIVNAGKITFLPDVYELIK
jgi:murein L,D-transpeptidase YcbB/YkuD